LDEVKIEKPNSVPTQGCEATSGEERRGEERRRIGRGEMQQAAQSCAGNSL